MRLILFIPVLIINILNSPFTASAEIGDKVPGCRIIYNSAKTELLNQLEKSERAFFDYRYTEFKIRIFEYHRLWEARKNSNDPLSKELRQAGAREEARLLTELKELDKKAQTDAGEMTGGLIAISQSGISLDRCCPDADVRECLGEALTLLADKAKETRDHFERVFEHEAEYRKAVGLTIGGRQGLYPEDTVEPEVKHAAFFPRYEVERRENRFDEDVKLVQLFQEMRKILTDEFRGDLCCLQCGKTDWDRKAK